MTPDIDYHALLPLLVVFGTAIVSVLVEAFAPARAPTSRRWPSSWADSPPRSSRW